MSFVAAHPYIVAALAAALIILGALEVGRYLRQNRRENYPRYYTDTLPDRDAPPDHRFHSGGIIPAGTTVPVLLDRDREHVLPLDHPLVRRMPMRNRFLPPDDESEAMVGQILADQHTVHVEHGAEVKDAGVEPDATTFYHLREVIGQFTYVIGKDGFVGIVEAMRSGEDAPMVEVPEHWREPITVAVFEVARLRHGR